MSQQTVLRILIVDDYAIVCEGLAAMLAGQPDMVLVGMAASGIEALVLVQRTCPDVVLLDLVMPAQDSLDSLAVLHAIKQARPATCVLMLTSMTDGAGIGAAIKAGAAGYIPKDAGREHILEAIRRLTRGVSDTEPTVLE
jgi:NarL family two-component system response regulator LiaR